MQYLKVMNKGTVHRKLLELIGFSTKRGEFNNLAIIGSKGSGAKLLIPAALRLGLKIFVCSSDEDGSYVLSYEARKIKLGSGEISQIYFVYSEDKVVPAQFILESFGDWDKPIGADTAKEFKIIREILANARDADPQFHWDIVDASEGGFDFKPDETTVFVSFSPGVAEITQNNTVRYFKFLGARPDYSVPELGEIYPKSSPETRVFVMGVLAECRSGSFFDETLFDYSLDDKNLLSEERTIKNEITLRRKVALLLASINSVNFSKELITGILAGKGGFENGCLKYLPDDLSAESVESFRAAWLEMESFGEKALIASTGNDAELLNEDARYRGYNVKQISHTGLSRLLCRAGVKCVSDVVTRRPLEESVVIVTPTEEEKKILDLALKIIRYYLSEAKEYQVRIFTIDDPRTEWDGIAGLGETRFKEILVNRNAFKKGVAYVLEILAHELRHCVSGANDYSAEFERQADKDEARIMLCAYLAHQAKNKE